MKLLYHGPFWSGSTALQRLEAFRAVSGVEVIAHDTNTKPTDRVGLYERVRNRLGWPVDRGREAARLTAAVAQTRPDVVLVDSSKVLGPGKLRQLRTLGVKTLAYYTPDDVMNRFNLKQPLRASLPEWDIFFTTKTFNLPELRDAGVSNAHLVGNAFDPALHRPLDPAVVGEDFEKFDFVFAGVRERERQASLNALGEAGFSVVIYGAGWKASELHPAITLRDVAFDQAYVKAMHHGKIALGFLRKINRDRITTRSMEITGAGRPMLAEKTDEHDAHFADGLDYAGFRNDEELLALARRYLSDDAARLELGRRGRLRCLESGYSTIDRACEMIATLKEATPD